MASFEFSVNSYVTKMLSLQFPCGFCYRVSPHISLLRANPDTCRCPGGHQRSLPKGTVQRSSFTHWLTCVSGSTFTAPRNLGCLISSFAGEQLGEISDKPLSSCLSWDHSVPLYCSNHGSTNGMSCGCHSCTLPRWSVISLPLWISGGVVKPMLTALVTAGM